METSLKAIVEAHPYIDRVLPFDLKGGKKRWRQGSYWKELFQAFSTLRKIHYDEIFDLQGNCKSGFLTLLAKGKRKVGFGRHSVREWPNLLVTHEKVQTSKSENMRLQYIALVGGTSPAASRGVYFKITKEEEERKKKILGSFTGRKIMVCPGSKWVNKQLTLSTWIQFLHAIQKRMRVSFLIVSGEEKELCQSIALGVEESHLVEGLSLPLWQNLMGEMDLVLAVDSSALHLCGTTATPSFSLFGPTVSHLFKPIGDKHGHYQSPCPYGQIFSKQCPFLRSCPTGACLRQIDLDALIDRFFSHCEKIY